VKAVFEEIHVAKSFYGFNAYILTQLTFVLTQNTFF